MKSIYRDAIIIVHENSLRERVKKVTEVDDCDTQTGKGLIVRQDKLFKLPGIQNRKIKKRKNKVQWIKY